MQAIKAPAAARHPAVFDREDWLLPFVPLMRHGDLQTIAGRYWPTAPDERRRPAQSRLFRTEADTQVLARLNLQRTESRAGPRPTVLAVHGLTACDRAPYMLAAGRPAREAGFDLIRLNVRNCGGTEHLSPTLYHSGLTIDLRCVVEQLAPRPLFLLGFSMGGNMALKLAGEWGENPPEHVRAACAISAPIRLDVCSRHIGKPRNRIYERRFLRQLRATMMRKSRCMPERYPQPDFSDVDSIWKFDDKFTAPSFGFRDAADYYARCSAAGFLGRIRVPALAIQAEDDPFIPFDAFRDRVFATNPWIRLLAQPHGGHVAFLSRQGARFWAQAQAIRFFEAVGRSYRDKPAIESSSSLPCPAAP